MKIFYKITLTLLMSLFIFYTDGYSQFTFVNNGGNVHVTSGTYFALQGNILNLSDGSRHGQIIVDGELSLTGTWTNNATGGDLLRGSSGKVEFKGTSAQTINGSRTTWFPTFLKNNNGDISMTTGSHITGDLQFGKDGLINVPNNQSLIMENNSTTPSSGSLATTVGRYVNGIMTKIGNTTFTFPVGNATRRGCFGILLSPNNSSSSALTIKYYSSSHSNVQPTPPPHTNALGDVCDSSENTTQWLHNVSQKEWWNLSSTSSPTVGPPYVAVRLHYDSDTFSVIKNDNADLRVGHYVYIQTGYTSSKRSGRSLWFDEGGAGTHTTNTTFGNFVTSNFVNIFGPFTFASRKEDQVNPLPVELLSFNATKRENDVLLNWVTATEINNDYFDVERSVNGSEFEKIGQVKGSGNSNVELNYDFIDDNVRPVNTYYYRLKQVDFDGTYEYSEVKSVEFDGNKDFAIKMFPNPANSNVTFVTNSDEEVELSIMDGIGKVVWKGEVVHSKTISVSDFSKGVYYVKMQNSNLNKVEKLEVIK